MPQMAANGLSENWLFKHCGDYHWTVLCENLGLSSSELCSDTGERLYPSFIAISARYSRPLASISENEQFEESITLSNFGRSFFCSTVKISNQKTVLTQEMVTAFVSRLKEGTNSLRKSTPAASVAYGTPELAVPTALLQKSKQLRSGQLEFYRLLEHDIPLKGPGLGLVCEYLPSPYIDYNGANLLYFASYPTICDTLERQLIHKNSLFVSDTDWALSASTVARDVFYSRNLDIGRALVARLKQFLIVKDEVLTHTTLLALDDQQPLAEVFTLKQLVRG